MTIKITSATFSACVVGKDGLPDDQLPVIALVGRSNVGKSSLINCITGRKELARTSSLPGKTLTINYYCINELFYIVDLPGYGYAKASKVTRQRIQNMMNEFFAESKNLRGVVQVLDIRHNPSPLDTQMQSWIKDQKINSIAVLTKADKLSNQQVIKMRTSIVKDLGVSFAMAFSAKSAAGKDDFLDAVEKIIAGLELKAPDRSRKGALPSREPRSKQENRRPPRNPAKPESPDAGKPSEKTSPDKSPAKVQESDKGRQAVPGQEPRSGQNRRRRWKNKKSGGSDDKKKQPET
jgi:GTP-binding protein